MVDGISSSRSWESFCSFFDDTNFWFKITLDGNFVVNLLQIFLAGKSSQYGPYDFRISLLKQEIDDPGNLCSHYLKEKNYQRKFYLNCDQTIDRNARYVQLTNLGGNNEFYLCEIEIFQGRFL